MKLQVVNILYLRLPCPTLAPTLVSHTPSHTQIHPFTPPPLLPSHHPREIAASRERVACAPPWEWYIGESL